MTNLVTPAPVAVVGTVPAPRTPAPSVADLQRELDEARARVQAAQARLDPALTARVRAAVAPGLPPHRSR